MKPDRPSADVVASLIKLHYEACGGAGGCLHVQCDDGNLDNCFFDDKARDWVKNCENKCRTGLVVFDALKAMRKTARIKACRLALRDL